MKAFYRAENTRFSKGVEVLEVNNDRRVLLGMLRV
jgi:hypothetical protein